MCEHKSMIGDNYGITCAVCNEVLEGFGFHHTANSCRHVWYSEDGPLSVTRCLWCNEIKSLSIKIESAGDALTT